MGTGAGQPQQRTSTSSKGLDLNTEQLSSVQKYLKGDTLSSSEKSILRTIPLRRWTKATQVIDGASSPLINFSVSPDSILRVTL